MNVAHFNMPNKLQYLLGDYPLGQTYYQFQKSRSVWWIARKLRHKKSFFYFLIFLLQKVSYTIPFFLKINYITDNKITPWNMCQRSQNNICQCLLYNPVLPSENNRNRIVSIGYKEIKNLKIFLKTFFETFSLKLT